MSKGLRRLISHQFASARTWSYLAHLVAPRAIGAGLGAVAGTAYAYARYGEFRSEYALLGGNLGMMAGAFSPRKFGGPPQAATHTASPARVFKSSDTHVGPTAAILDQHFPGRVVDINQDVQMLNGLTREIDIVMDQFYIQVKGGRANGLASQIEETINSVVDKSKMVIGYAPDNYSGHAWSGAAKKGIAIARDINELLEIIKEHTRY